MNSIRDLNRSGMTDVIEITDDRPPQVIFDSDMPQTNFTVNINEGQTYTLPIGINILEIINYQVCAVNVTITFSASNVATVQIPTLPNYMTATTVGNTITISGLRSRVDWDLVAGLTVQSSSAYSGSYTVTCSINYLGDQSQSWITAVTVVDIAVFGPTTLFNYTGGQTENITGQPTFSDPGGEAIQWTVTITPSNTGGVTTITTTGTGGTFTFNNTTKVTTIVGTPSQISSRLAGLRLQSSQLRNYDFSMTYVATNTTNNETDIAVQQFKSINFTLLAATRSSETFTPNVSTAITGGPFITDTAYTGNALYTMSVKAQTANDVTVMSGLNPYSSWTLNSTFTHPLFGTNTIAKVSRDGTTLVLCDSNFNSNRGRILVYTKSGTSWIIQESLYLRSALGGQLANDYFGSFNSTDISDDGNIVVTSVTNRDTNRGALFVFRRTNNVWDTGVKLQHDTPVSGDRMGRVVKISGDGNYIAASADLATVNSSANAGFVVVFRFSSNAWSSVKIFDPVQDNIVNNYFGWAIQMSGDGRYLVITTYTNQDYTQSKVYIYYRASTSFGSQYTFSAGVANSQLRHISINYDGTVFVFHDPDNELLTQSLKYIRVYTRTSTNTWTENKSFEILNDDSDICIDRSGHFIATHYLDTVRFYRSVGTQWYEQGSVEHDFFAFDKFLNDNSLIFSNYGNTYIYTKTALLRSTPSFTRLIDAADTQSFPLTAQSNVRGYGTVAMSRDGTVAVVHHLQTTGAGNIFIHTRSGTTWTLRQTLDQNSSADQVQQASQVLGWLWNQETTHNYITLSDNGNYMVYCNSRTITGGDLGRVYIFARSVNTWTLQTTLNIDNASSVNINSDGNMLVVGRPGRDWGYAYIYTRSGTTWTLSQTLTPESADIAVAKTDDYRNFGLYNQISSTGDTIAINWSTFRRPATTTTVGLLYVYQKSGSTWTRQLRHESTSGSISKEIALKSDGNVVSWFQNTLVARRRTGTTWGNLFRTKNTPPLIENTEPFIVTSDDRIIGGNDFLSYNGITQSGYAAIHDIRLNPNYISGSTDPLYALERIELGKILQSPAASASVGFGGRIVASSDGKHILVAAFNSDNHFKVYYYATEEIGTTWDSSTRTLTFTHGKDEINIAIDSITMTANVAANFELIYTVTTPTNGSTARNQFVNKV